MGPRISKVSSSGILRGAYAPPLEGINMPEVLDPNLENRYNIVVPEGKGAGDYMTVIVNEREVIIRIPDKIEGPDGHRRRPKTGDRFPYVYRERSRVIASTLPSLPGAVIVESKPIIFANASKVFSTRSGLRNNDEVRHPFEPRSLSEDIGNLMQETQELLLQKTVEVGCNCVLGINTSVTVDSGGETENSKIVIITFTGTPCRVVQAAALPAVNVEATLVPGVY